MRVLILGGGGREHALAWKLRQSPRLSGLVALPGNDAIAALADCVPGDPCDSAAVVAAVREHKIDLVVIGPEAPLAAGVSDALLAESRQEAGVHVFGPSRAAAQLESSKIFAKQFMQRHGIPSARFGAAEDIADAERLLREYPLPVVVKADGLAAGKGVVIAATRDEALAACREMLSGRLAGGSGARIVIEEHLAGEELSLLFLCDGERALPLAPAQDHKRVFDGDEGPNTGGMGAYSLDCLVTPELVAGVQRDVVGPVLRGMASTGAPYRGVLYCGLMLTAAGPRVLEFNARFGDPETQPILLRLEGDLLPALDLCAAGSLESLQLRWSPQPAVAVVVASGGYPGSYKTGLPIRGLATDGSLAATVPGGSDTVVFHAGTRRNNGEWVTSGGRVLAVTARADSLEQALAHCHAAVETIYFEGMHYRRDIGYRRLRGNTSR
jgi:phosphoribosylamine--glycine ligase